jgi:1-deoxy-D-xylulose-5-phosphate synthase
MPLLDRIDSPADLRSLSRDELHALADELRDRMVDVCSRTGGHIGAGLGVVELTIALHYAFQTPTDRLVWDVGHQGYPHKLLTGRNSRMESLRKEGGVSGFLKRSESAYDAFGAGHAATAISAALGIAAARDINGETFRVAAILGDGALTSGLAYEGLNNAGQGDTDIVVVLNDNEMSIAPNVGAMHKYLGSIQRNPLYNRIRNKIGEMADNAPGPVGAIVRKWEESLKNFLTPGVLFESSGFATSVPSTVTTSTRCSTPSPPCGRWRDRGSCTSSPRRARVSPPASRPRVRSGTPFRQATIRPPASR